MFRKASSADRLRDPRALRLLEEVRARESALAERAQKELYRLLREGEIKSVKIGGSRRIRMTALRESTSRASMRWPKRDGDHLVRLRRADSLPIA
jgi:hypothetical protein